MIATLLTGASAPLSSPPPVPQGPASSSAGSYIFRTVNLLVTIAVLCSRVAQSRTASRRGKISWFFYLKTRDFPMSTPHLSNDCPLDTAGLTALTMPPSNALQRLSPGRPGRKL
jgi:hypothetical protein